MTILSVLYSVDNALQSSLTIANIWFLFISSNCDLNADIQSTIKSNLLEISLNLGVIFNLSDTYFNLSIYDFLHLAYGYYGYKIIS